MNGIWGIILAAGESKRMKTPKMLLPFRGKTILENVIENVLASEVDDTLVVLGAEKEDTGRIISGYPVKLCYNEHYRAGMLSSVKCGFEFLPGVFDAVLVFLGDQPWIKPEITAKVISTWKASGKGLVMPAYKGRRGHPLLIAAKYKPEIGHLDTSGGLRELALKYPHDVAEIDTGTPDILKDIDTPEDYINELKQIN